MLESQFELLSYKFTLINLLDLVLVVFLSFQLFKLLKGSLAFNILIGLLTIYIFWLAVNYFEMPLMANVLGQFAQVGIIAVLIVFQQEIRKFLLVIGNSSLLGENKKWWNNGVECKYCETQPEGFVRGRLSNHKRGLTPGLEVGTKLNISDDERKRRSESMKKMRSGTLFQLDSLTSVNIDSNLSSQTQDE